MPSFARERANVDGHRVGRFVITSKRIWQACIRVRRDKRVGDFFNEHFVAAYQQVGDFTVTRLGLQRFILLGSGPMQRYHMRWFEQNLPADGSIRVENLSARYCGLHIAGPAARALLQAVARDDDVGGNAFPFLSASQARAVSLGKVSRVGRVFSRFARR